ncbi:MAG: RNA polymerase sigma factor [Actinomycetota bacterium]
MTEITSGDLVTAASGGNQGAWDGLVERFGNLVWSITRAHRLSDADAADVSQTTWLRLVENLDRIRDPERVGSWLAATARNECLRVLRRAGRNVPVGDDAELEAESSSSPDSTLLTTERDAALWRAFAGLGERCRMLLRLLMADPPASYEEISAATGSPIGSIGPTRARCLAQLKRHALVAGIASGDAV